MKYVVILTRREGIATERFAPSARAELLGVWEGIKSGLVRAAYAIAEGGSGAVLELECASAAEARRYIEALVYVQEGLLDVQYLGLAPFTGLEKLFQPA